MCDNVDCKDLANSENKVKLRKEFGSDIVVWCKDCIARDKDMIEYNFFEEKTYEDETNNELEHINTMCKIILNMVNKKSAWFMSTDNLEALRCNVEIIQEIVKGLII